jgi:hypothetical protein
VKALIAPRIDNRKIGLQGIKPWGLNEKKILGIIPKFSLKPS